LAQQAGKRRMHSNWQRQKNARQISSGSVADRRRIGDEPPAFRRFRRL
jgi:hypothetical protein